MIRIIPLAGLLLMAHALASCSDSKPVAASGPPPPPVTVAHPLHKTIAEWDEYTGRFVAVETVKCGPASPGTSIAVNFNEGQMVKQGDPLFVIDPRPYNSRLSKPRPISNAPRQSSRCPSTCSERRLWYETRP